MPSPGIEPRNSQQKWFLFYNFLLDLSEIVKQDADATNQVKNHLFFSKPMLKDLAKILNKHGFNSRFPS